MIPRRTRRLALVLASAAMLVTAAPPVSAQSPRALLAKFEAQARKAGTWPGGFSSARGKALFLARHGGGKPDTPSCTSCHTGNPAKAGRTRAGKIIQPMALSKTPDRFSDPKKVAKWFRRNCRSVLGRECTPLEKGDFLTFMINQ